MPPTTLSAVRRSPVALEPWLTHPLVGLPPVAHFWKVRCIVRSAPSELYPRPPLLRLFEEIPSPPTPPPPASSPHSSSNGTPYFCRCCPT
jgi:hypothetical protein